MVEKRDAGFNLRFAFAVEIEADGNLRFLGVARDFCRPDFHDGD
jgi:hypothetical protein